MNPSEQIDKQIASYTDWRGKLMAHLRDVIHQADPEIVEQWKWDTGVYSHNGLMCAVSAFKDHVKLNFFKGSELKDSNKLINAGFESKRNKAIDFSKNDILDDKKIIALIQEAVALNIK